MKIKSGMGRGRIAPETGNAGPMEEPPRIALLRSRVLSLPVDERYRAALLGSIDTCREQILARPVDAPAGGWDDLEALQQVTLGDAMERALRKKAGGGS